MKCKQFIARCYHYLISFISFLNYCICQRRPSWENILVLINTFSSSVVCTHNIKPNWNRRVERTKLQICCLFVFESSYTYNLYLYLYLYYYIRERRVLFWKGALGSWPFIAADNIGLQRHQSSLWRPALYWYVVVLSYSALRRKFCFNRNQQ